MRVTAKRGNPQLATVYMATLSDGHGIEFVESVQPPIPREEKWVLIVSTLRGCPVNCPICDAGMSYAGRLTAGEILQQIDHMVTSRYPDRVVPVPKFKIQFARMGDPAFNPAVLEVLRTLPSIYRAPGLLPSLSTIAPEGCRDFLEELLLIKEELYSGGKFQMQFSIHSSSAEARSRLVPCPTLSFDRISEWGRRWHRKGDRKISLNFAAVEGYPLDPAVIAAAFPPSCFMIKLTPVNPTASTERNRLRGVIDPDRPGTARELVEGFRSAGFDTLLSIGDTRENQIGSNCGMYVGAYVPELPRSTGHTLRP